MEVDKYKKVRAYLDAGVQIPDTFFEPSSNGESCIFMLSCLGTDKLLYIDDNFKSLSGYSSEKLQESGMDFWFALIHPDDREQVSKKIIESHKQLGSSEPNDGVSNPLILTYRIKHFKGHWTWVTDTKYLVSFSNKVIDKVLGKFEFISSVAVAEDLKKKLEEEKSCTQLLDYALVHQHDKRKQTLNSDIDHKMRSASTPALTRREKEILQLIAEGLSTKLIADKCNISINTVETHWRHLLEKLKVKNSMELIKEASKIYWL